MKQTLLLTKMQMGSAMDFLNVFRRKKIQKKTTSVKLILLGSFLFFAFLMGFYIYTIAMLLQKSGELDSLPGAMMTITCFLILLMSIYKVKGTLFGFKDYDMVMSLPIKTGKVVASRLLLLYIVNIFFTFVIMLPTTVIYGYFAKPSVMFYIYSVIGILFLPLVPIILSSLIGTIIAAVSSKFRKSNIVNMILMVVFFMLIMVGSFSLSEEQQLIDISSSLDMGLRQYYPLADFYLDGVVGGSLSSMLLFVSISLLAFLLFSGIFGILFTKLNTSITTSKTRSHFKLKDQALSTPFIAYYKKERKRLFSSPMYVMNSLMGLFLMTLGAIALLIFQKQAFELLRDVMGGGTKMFSCIGMLLLGFFISTVFPSASSISLEGKSLWILKSSPVPAKVIFNSKIFLNIFLALPFIIIDGVVLCILIKPGIMEAVLLFAFPIAYLMFVAVFGLCINLRYPVFDWTSETVVIKNSASSIITMLGSMAILAIPAVLMFTLLKNLDPLILLGGATILIFIVTLVMKLSLDRRSEEILRNLG